MSAPLSVRCYFVMYLLVAFILRIDTSTFLILCMKFGIHRPIDPAEAEILLKNPIFLVEYFQIILDFSDFPQINSKVLFLSI